MIVEIIAKYLSSNKRLVVPNLGTFIVKVPAQTILFSNLIKNDDGCLRGLLKSEGMPELDAAALIDRFVFEVNYRLEHSGVCALGGFGVLRSGANGTVSFTFDLALEFSAFSAAVCFSVPMVLSLLYLVVVRIA